MKVLIVIINILFLCFFASIVIAGEVEDQLVKDAAKYLYSPSDKDGQEGMDGIVDYSKDRVMDTGNNVISSNPQKMCPKCKKYFQDDYKYCPYDCALLINVDTKGHSNKRLDGTIGQITVFSLIGNVGLDDVQKHIELTRYDNFIKEHKKRTILRTGIRGSGPDMNNEITFAFHSTKQSVLDEGIKPANVAFMVVGADKQYFSYIKGVLLEAGCTYNIFNFYDVK